MTRGTKRRNQPICIGYTCFLRSNTVSISLSPKQSERAAIVQFHLLYASVILLIINRPPVKFLLYSLYFIYHCLLTATEMFSKLIKHKSVYWPQLLFVIQTTYKMQKIYTIHLAAYWDYSLFLYAQVPTYVIQRFCARGKSLSDPSVTALVLLQAHRFCRRQGSFLGVDQQQLQLQ